MFPLFLSFLVKTTTSIHIMGGHARNAAAEPKPDQDLEALKAARIPLAFRDTCGHLLLDLNKCRRPNYFNPSKCGHERHTYEECEYYAWMDRVAKKGGVAQH